MRFRVWRWWTITVLLMDGFFWTIKKGSAALEKPSWDDTMLDSSWQKKLDFFFGLVAGSFPFSSAFDQPQLVPIHKCPYFSLKWVICATVYLIFAGGPSCFVVKLIERNLFLILFCVWISDQSYLQWFWKWICVFFFWKAKAFWSFLSFFFGGGVMEIYSFSHNHGSRKLPEMQGN